MNILFISIEGNTRSFLTRLQAYAQQQHSFNPQLPTINLKEITDQTLPANTAGSRKRTIFCFCANLSGRWQWL